MNNVQISVIICTYNRSNILSGSIESLMHQTADKEIFEIIVVDNNSTDNTKEIVNQFRNAENLRYIFEPNQGLSHARNRGFREAKGEYVAYIDDDARADPDWITGIYMMLQELNPRPIGIGGPIYPFYLSEKPDWFLDEYEIRSWGDAPRYLKKGEFFSGSNMVFSKAVLERLGGFDINLGVKGETLNLGEETRLFNKIWDEYNEKEMFYYSPDLKVYHLVPADKMNLHYFFKRRFMVGQSSLQTLYSPLDNLKKISLIVGFSGFILYKTIVAIVKLPFYRSFHTWVIECMNPVIVGLGLVCACVGIRCSFGQFKIAESER
ncbi:glycosyltransferase [Methanocalculus sp.]|uniref:glycosyltransferase n=1 Tax=Methanocalculus sp. TaxID=2004547 RepID=UPI002626F43D|nr:glycosyltransferase [Methanocalculus sp.]MDG6249254.1 glycosyltransferase [Methanocalculus sp.]